jgi:hypothetical protein
MRIFVPLGRSFVAHRKQLTTPRVTRKPYIFAHFELAAICITNTTSRRSVVMRPLNAAQRYRLTSSLFLLTFFGAVFTVAAPSVFPCPAFEHRRPGLAHADGWSWDGLSSNRRRRRRAIIKDQPRDDTGNDKSENGDG